MKRENRINLWFLGIFLTVTLPGVVILVRKRMHGGAPPLMYPDAMSHRLAYMTPLPAPPDATWVVPPVTKAWIDELAVNRCGATRAEYGTDVHGDPVPMISDDHVAQVVFRGDPPPGHRAAAIVLWQETSKDPSATDFDLCTEGLPRTDSASAAARIVVPQQVRQELMACGYLRPPHAITWVEFSPGTSAWISIIQRLPGGDRIAHPLFVSGR